MAGQEERRCYNLDHGGVVVATVRDGKIVRVQPLYLSDDDAPSWKIRVGDRVFTPPRRSNATQFTISMRRRVYASNRVLYPMKREDFDPDKKDRKTENRGKSKYVRITWKEAADIVAKEVRRIRSEYGPAAIAAMMSSHQMWGYLNASYSAFTRFWSILGYTEVLNNSDSWEGWSWGAEHAWGFYWRLGLPDQYDLLDDALKNTDMIVLWSADPDATNSTYAGYDSVTVRRWLKELGKEIVVIDPYCNYTAVRFADKWIAPKPGTDAALAAAIAHVWIKEGTYDKWFVENRTIGFDKFSDYVMGKEDGIPKTPEWAERITGVPAREIRALAREWARKRTMLGPGNRAGMGGACRAPYGHEWARMMVYLQAMQGLGKPGVNFWATNTALPSWEEFNFPGYVNGGMNVPGIAKQVYLNPVKQKLLRTLVPDAFLSNRKLSWRGFGFNLGSTEQQFQLNIYPLPKPDGAPVRMLYRFGSAYPCTMPDGNRWVRAYRSPRLEFFVVQNPWLEGEAKFADLILPAATNLEREDIAEWNNGGGASGAIPHGSNSNAHRIIVYMQKCIEPLGESKSDFHIFLELARALGIEKEYSEGEDVEGWLRRIYESSDMKDVMPFEKFRERGYYVVPVPEDDVSHRSFATFYELGRGLATPTGKIEFESRSLAKFDPKDPERPLVAHYIPSWEGPESPAAKRYPLVLITPHVRFSFHSQHDGEKNPWIDEIPHHRVYKDGRYWWPLWINPADAERRGIKDGDLVKVYNDRGAVACIARVSERARPGSVHAYQASAIYEQRGEPGNPGSVDVGGCVNILTSLRFMSKNAHGFAPAHALVEVEKWGGS
jgi:trimethylamine-N-oxide reductase (cytochrome c)